MSTQISVGVDLKSIINFLKSFAPVNLSESWDNTGLLVEPSTVTPVKCVLLTNDLTEDVLKEALEFKTGLIISYHPPIFKPLAKITTSSWKVSIKQFFLFEHVSLKERLKKINVFDQERIIGTCLENKIAIYSPHTSWDSISGGVNDWLAKGFGNNFVKFVNHVNFSILFFLNVKP